MHLRLASVAAATLLLVSAAALGLIPAAPLPKPPRLWSRGRPAWLHAIEFVTGPGGDAVTCYEATRAYHDIGSVEVWLRPRPSVVRRVLDWLGIASQTDPVADAAEQIRYRTGGGRVVRRDGVEWSEWVRSDGGAPPMPGAERFVGPWAISDGAGAERTFELTRDGEVVRSLSLWMREGWWSCEGRSLLLDVGWPSAWVTAGEAPPVRGRFECALDVGDDAFAGTDEHGRTLRATRVTAR